MPDNKTSLVQIALLTYLGQFLTFIIPVRLGEFAKGIYISTQTKQPLTQSILWVFIDRLVDFWVVISLIGLLLLLTQTAIPSNVNLTIAGLAAALSVGLIVTVYYPKFVKKTAEIVLSLVFIKRLRKLLSDFSSNIIDSFSILKVKPEKQLLLVAITAFSWLFESITWYMALSGLGANISVLGVVLGTMLMALSFLLPSAPGYLGSLQAAGLLVFGLWLGIDAVTVSAGTILMHASIMIYVLLVGVSSLYFLKLDLGDLFKRFKAGKS